jgi:tRNA pseudouridine38-40 synthase
MHNYLINIEYDGTKYVGWQNQKNGASIQGNIESALKKIFKKKIRLLGAGRTDKGVHAYNQCANFKADVKIEDKVKFLNSINFFLKKKLISILDIKKKKLLFHARHSAKIRVYEYFIINRVGSLSIFKNRAWHVKKKLSLEFLKKGTKVLEGTHDFSTFRSSSCSAKSPIKKMQSIKVKKNGDKILIIFKSQSFLQNQVRSMVGCLKLLALNKWSLKRFQLALKSRDRKLCGAPAPAHGLYLKEIRY